MEHFKASLIVVVLFALTIPANSQPLFYSQSLQKLYISLPIECRIEKPVAETVVMCTKILPDFTVPVSFVWDSYDMLEHVGYRFLPEGMDTLFHPAVVRFLERELLALLTTDNLKQKLTFNKDNGLTILLNGVTPPQGFYRNRNGLPFLLQHVIGMDIRFEDRRKYQVDLKCEQNQTVSFYFVADAELLSDMDKEERDKRLAAKLSYHHAKSSPRHTPAYDVNSMQPYRESVFVCKGASFIIPQVNNNLYYFITNGTPTPVFNREQLDVSFSNAMLNPSIGNFSINITQSMYGGVTSQYSVKSHDFYDFFSKDFDLYFGIEPSDGSKLNGMLILSDRTAANIHLAHISVSVEDLLNEGTIEMRLHSNIPLHNVLTLFGEKIKK